MFCGATFYNSLLNLLTFAVKFIQRDASALGQRTCVAQWGDPISSRSDPAIS